MSKNRSNLRFAAIVGWILLVAQDVVWMAQDVTAVHVLGLVLTLAILGMVLRAVARDHRAETTSLAAHADAVDEHVGEAIQLSQYRGGHGQDAA